MFNWRYWTCYPVLLSAVVLCLPRAAAETKRWVCISDAATGLKMEAGKWITAAPTHSRFMVTRKSGEYVLRLIDESQDFNCTILEAGNGETICHIEPQRDRYSTFFRFNEQDKAFLFAHVGSLKPAARPGLQVGRCFAISE